jgi:hypothetical protein
MMVMEEEIYTPTTDMPVIIARDALSDTRSFTVMEYTQDGSGFASRAGGSCRMRRKRDLRTGMKYIQTEYLSFSRIDENISF